MPCLNWFVVRGGFGMMMYVVGIGVRIYERGKEYLLDGLIPHVRIERPMT